MDPGVNDPKYMLPECKIISATSTFFICEIYHTIYLLMSFFSQNQTKNVITAFCQYMQINPLCCIGGT